MLEWITSAPLPKSVVISAAFADAYPGKLEPLGKFKLKDVEGEQALFTLSSVPST